MRASPIALAILLGLAFCRPAESQPRGADRDDPDQPDTLGAAKFCSVVDVVGGSLRSTIVVPESWTIEDCQDFADSLSAKQFQVGCIFSDGAPKFSWGGAQITVVRLLVTAAGVHAQGDSGDGKDKLVVLV